MIPRLTPRRIAVAVALAVAFGFVLSPLGAAKDPPLVDLPNNVGAVSIWNDYDDAKFGYQRHYDLNRQPVPYWGYYGFMHVASWVMPVRAASKVFIGLTIVGLVAGMAALLGALGRPRALALVALPFAWSYSMAWGFIAYIAGIALFLFACASLVRLADARPWPTRRQWAVNVGWGIGLALFHPLPLLLWLGAAIVLAGRRGLVTILPALAFFAWQVLRAPGAGLRAAAKMHVLRGEWSPPGKALDNFERFTLDFLEKGWRRAAILAAMASVALGVVLMIRDRAVTADRRPWLLIAFVAGCYLFLPVRLEEPVSWSLINTRLPWVVLMMVPLLVPRGALPSWRGWAAALPAVLAASLFSMEVAKRFSGFDRRARDFYAVVDKLPYDPNVITLVYKPDDPVLQLKGWGWVWRHWHSYVQVERGGYDPYAWSTGFPFVTKPGVAGPTAKSMNPGPIDPKMFEHYEYFLTQSEPAALMKGKPVELVAHQGAWRLWRKTVR
jgi:hypothetical protein